MLIFRGSVDNPPPKVVQGYKACTPLRDDSQALMSPLPVQHFLPRPDRQIEGTYIQNGERARQRGHSSALLQCRASLRRHCI